MKITKKVIYLLMSIIILSIIYLISTKIETLAKENLLDSLMLTNDLCSNQDSFAKYDKYEYEDYLKADSLNFVIKKGHRLEGNSDFNDIQVFFPQIDEMDDKLKMQEINSIIKKEASKTLDENEDWRKNNLDLYLNYKILFLNSNIMSIIYEGQFGYKNEKKFFPEFIGSTINLKENKIVVLSDIIIDIDSLYELLYKDKFVCIPGFRSGAGETGITLFSKNEIHKYYTKEQQIEFLKGDYKSFETEDKKIDFFDWYFLGNRLVIVALYNEYYEQYYIDLDEIQDIINLDFYNNYM